MIYNKKEAVNRLYECKSILSDYHMPSWDELPSIDLYMDQVIEVTNSYMNIPLSIIEPEITRPMINNYVKLKMMPPPVKKKYSKVHLAYIIIICTLKQTLNISTIQKILPTEISDEEVKKIYQSFTKNQRAAIERIYTQVESAANPILKAEDDNSIDDLIMQVASSANILKCLTEKIVNTENLE